MSLTERERIILLRIRGFGDRQRSFNETKHLFNDTFPDRPPISKSTVIRTIQRFDQTGTCKDRQRSGRPRTVANEEKSLEIMQHFVEEPNQSLRKVSSQSDVGFVSVRNVLISNKFHPYKITLVQELFEDDFDRRIEFCEVMMEKWERNQNFFNNIIFSDESTFMLNGTVNRHNCRYWADENPHWMRESHTQYPEKVNVWAGIIQNQIIGPFFIEGNLNSVQYLHMLEDQILPEIINRRGHNLQSTWFQQDGAPAHFGINVRRFLDATFPNRWIGRRGAIEWPARSPDLTPLDYFLWGHLKNKVFTTKPENIDVLKDRIRTECQLINPVMLQNVINKFYYNLGHCQVVQGGHFQHLIK